MAAHINEIISRAAGWTQAVPDEKGEYHYFLEGGLDLDIRPLDDRRTVVSALLEPAPARGEPGAEDHWRRLGLAACAVMNTQGSILAKDRDGSIVLYRRLDTAELSEEEIVREARDFLNDEAWWRGFLSEGEARGPAFAADFSSWFPPQFSL